jgi:hypothetical protein
MLDQSTLGTSMNTPNACAISLYLMTVFTAGAASAADCDCQTVVANCSGAIEFVRGYGSSKNYGAEIKVHSSAPSCSKVEYFVDSTPYQTILINRNEESESLFGTSPITEKNIKYSACRVCKGGQGASGKNAAGQGGQGYKSCSPGDSGRTKVTNGSIYSGAIGCDSYYLFAFGSGHSTLSELRGQVTEKAASLCGATAFVVDSSGFTENDWFPRQRYFTIVHCKGQDSAAHLKFAPISQYSRDYDPSSDTFTISAPSSAVTTRN